VKPVPLPHFSHGQPLYVPAVQVPVVSAGFVNSPAQPEMKVRQDVPAPLERSIHTIIKAVAQEVLAIVDGDIVSRSFCWCGGDCGKGSREGDESLQGKHLELVIAYWNKSAMDVAILSLWLRTSGHTYMLA
jgi:hypothetical protein